MSISLIADEEHPVKVGLSDAYIIERTIFCKPLYIYQSSYSYRQLNEYETVLYFLQLSQNLTWEFVDFCAFTCFYQFLHDVLIKLFCCDLRSSILWAHHPKTGKNTEMNKQSDVKFWLNWKNSLSCINEFSRYKLHT